MQQRGLFWFRIILISAVIIAGLGFGYFLAGGIGRGPAVPDVVQLPTPVPMSPSVTPQPEMTLTPESPAPDSPAPESPTPDLPTSTPDSPTPTPDSPRSTPQPEVFIEDDFSSPNRGWPVNETETWSATYYDEQYQLQLNGQTSIGFTAALPAENYRLQVDVSVVHGGAGLVFLNARPSINYRFLITPDGAYSIERQDESEATKIVDWTPSPALSDTPGTPNRIQIEREDNEIRFFAADELLTTLEVPSEPVENRFGFVLVSRTGQALATFDNLRGEYIR